MLSLVETFGYRQLNSWWRITGLWEAMRKKQGWGAMTRTGAAAGDRPSFGGGRYWSLRAEIAHRLGKPDGQAPTEAPEPVGATV
jgi:hypothetical protein